MAVPILGFLKKWVVPVVTDIGLLLLPSSRGAALVPDARGEEKLRYLEQEIGRLSGDAEALKSAVTQIRDELVRQNTVSIQMEKRVRLSIAVSISATIVGVAALIWLFLRR